MDVSYLPGLTIIDDTALNPGSIEAVFNTLRTFNYRQLIVVNAIRGCRGPAINAANAEVFAQWQRYCPHLLVVTSSVGNVGPCDVVTAAEKAAFLDTLSQQAANFIYTDTLPAALSYAIDHARPGDMIALLGAQGMDEGKGMLSKMVLPAVYHPELAQLAMTKT
jgi:UDP-N-acetylmuramoyl-L-alanyl-D-glutamate--2,6-diaminopimelate ligase